MKRAEDRRESAVLAWAVLVAAAAGACTEKTIFVQRPPAAGGGDVAGSSDGAGDPGKGDEPEPSPAPEPTPDEGPKADVEVETAPGLEDAGEVADAAGPAPEPEGDEAGVEPEVLPDADAPDADAGGESDPEPELPQLPDAAPDLAPEAEPSPEPDVQPEPEPEPEPAADPMPDAAVEPDPGPEPEEIVDPEPGVPACTVLSAEEKAKIDVLRDASKQGLEVGKAALVSAVSKVLSDEGLASPYKPTLDETLSGAGLPLDGCPFVKYFPNGFEELGKPCDVLVDLAFAKLLLDFEEIVAANPLPSKITGSPYAEEAAFWYEEAIHCGVDQWRPIARTDLKKQGACFAKPTPISASYDQGLAIGMKYVVTQVNGGLDAAGFAPEYPSLVSEICDCSAPGELLLKVGSEVDKPAPVPEAAIASATPLCPGYEPPTETAAEKFVLAQDAYVDGIERGLGYELALANVKFFRHVTCLVGDPLVLDLDGDGLELVPLARGVDFDLDGRGRPRATAWVASDDALLGLDRDGDGLLTSGAELFAGDDGFSALAVLDLPPAGGDGDGFLTPADARFGQVVVWRDLDTDGACDPGELADLGAWGVLSLPLRPRGAAFEVGGISVPASDLARTTAGPRLLGDVLLPVAHHPHFAARAGR